MEAIASKPRALLYIFALFIVVLYVLHPNADNIGGFFGIYWGDEGAYLLSAKNYVLYGTTHIINNETWLPELISPLMHLVATLTITASDTVTYTRLCVMLCVLAGIFTLSRIAEKYHGHRNHALICFICIALNPVLFFYARIGLAEGLQFTIMSTILAIFYQVYTTGKTQLNTHYAFIIGILNGALLIAKISAVGACVGISIGMLMCSTHYSRKNALIFLSSFAFGIIFAVVIYVTLLMPGTVDQWWAANVVGQVSQKISSNLHAALLDMSVKFLDMAYFLGFMPIFAVYFMSLFICLNKKNDFLFILAIITLTTILVESIFGGTIRRNFFGLSLLSVLFGFICSEFFSVYNNRKLSNFNKLQWAAFILLLLHALGVALLLLRSILQKDMVFILFSASLLFLGLFTFTSFMRSEYKRLRIMVASIVCICVLAPMIYQSFFAPYTRYKVSLAIENLVPEDAYIIGPQTPWLLTGVKRKIILTDCYGPGFIINYSNNINMLMLDKPVYYLSYWPTLDNDPCAPNDIENYSLKGDFSIVNTQNMGYLREGSLYWRHYNRQFIYEKIHE